MLGGNEGKTVEFVADNCVCRVQARVKKKRRHERLIVRAGRPVTQLVSALGLRTFTVAGYSRFTVKENIPQYGEEKSKICSIIEI